MRLVHTEGARGKESALAAALAEGYSGIRVAADNTPLITDEGRLTAWIRWEVVADRFMSENQVTGRRLPSEHLVLREAS